MPDKGHRGGRKILDVNKPVRERQKPGPKPKPKPKPDPLLVDPATYVPPPRKKPKIRYTNEQIVEVLQFMYYHRILDKKPDGTVGEKLPRYRSGTILQKRPDLAVAPEGFRYRSPTYEEAGDWFQIPKSTVSTWWNTKLEMIGIQPEEVPQAPMPDFLKNRPSITAQQAQAQAQAQQHIQQSGPVNRAPAVSISNGNPVIGSHVGIPVVPGQPGPGQTMMYPVQGVPNPSQIPNPPQGVPTQMQRVVSPIGGPPVPVAPSPTPQQNGVAPSPAVANGAPAVATPPAPSSAGREEAAERSSRATTTDTPTPTPSEQLAEVSRFNEEVSNLDKAPPISGEDNEEGEDEEEL